MTSVIAFMHTEAPSDTEPCDEMQTPDRISDLELWQNVVERALAQAGYAYQPASTIQIAQSMLAFHEELIAAKTTLAAVAERSKASADAPPRPPTDAEALLNELSIYLKELLGPRNYMSEHDAALFQVAIAIDVVLGRRA
jgi:hypothetical protein